MRQDGPQIQPIQSRQISDSDKEILDEEDLPYSGPQLSESGLMKYGAVKVASHAPAKATADAIPKV